VRSGQGDGGAPDLRRIHLGHIVGGLAGDPRAIASCL
jgi:hypothetical protein